MPRILKIPKIALVLMAMACGYVPDRGSCRPLACDMPLVVEIDMRDFEGPTTVHVEPDGETFTVECPKPAGEGEARFCLPFQAITDQFVVGVIIRNGERTTLNVEVDGNYGRPPPRVTQIRVLSGTSVVFQDTIEADHGDGVEENGPGCGRCYDVVELARSFP
jgi:hypothetical protein